MLTIKNVSLQSLILTLQTNYGAKEHWLTPGASVVVADDFITESIKTLQKRKLVKITRA